MAERLKFFREKQKMSIQDIAGAIAVSETTYRDWERGSKIQGEPYVRICQILKISLNALLGAETKASSEELFNWLMGDLEMLRSRCCSGEKRQPEND